MTLINLMKKKTLKAKKCTLQDSKFIRDLYNINVKKNFFNSKKIVDLRSHEKWIKNILNSKNSEIYVGHINKKFGYVRIENLFSNFYSISIAITENYKGQGNGSSLLNLSIKKFFRKRKNFTLFAFVKKNNLRSQNFFLGNNFCKIKINKNKKLNEYINSSNIIFIYKENDLLNKTNY